MMLFDMPNSGEGGGVGNAGTRSFVGILAAPFRPL